MRNCKGLCTSPATWTARQQLSKKDADRRADTTTKQVCAAAKPAETLIPISRPDDVYTCSGAVLVMGPIAVIVQTHLRMAQGGAA